MPLKRTLFTLVAFLLCCSGFAFERPGTTFKIFQFPPNMIPRIDGDPSDWAIVPDEYVIGSDQLLDDSGKGAKVDPKSLDVRVKVGWVKGMNRLYFLYEAYDNYWDFAGSDLHNDTFEVIVDGDASGGPLIERFHPQKKDISGPDAYFAFQSVHAQNYHIFTPAEGKDWCMMWGPQQWLKELPYSNIAYNYNFKPGEAGKLIMEFWITPFDYAGAEGPQRAVESVLKENKIIGMSWAVIDYDNINSKSSKFWNLSPKHTMYGQASELVAFKLMPLEEKFKKPIDAKWSSKTIDNDRRIVAFKDLSEGQITSWKWEFGDGTTSTEQHPIHTYAKIGDYTPTLYVEGPAGKSRMMKVWHVTLR